MFNLYIDKAVYVEHDLQTEKLFKEHPHQNAFSEFVLVHSFLLPLKFKLASDIEI